jgi:hypothetical protein
MRTITAVVARISKLAGSLRREWRLMTVAAVLLLPTPALAFPAVPVAAPDPDAAAGLDNLVWDPAPGTRLMTSVPLPKRPVHFGAQEAPGEGARVVSSYCPAQDDADKRVAQVQGCFRIWADGSDSDPDANYYYEDFQIRATGRGTTRLARVKGRSQQDLAQNIHNDPGSDREVGEPTPIEVGIGPVSVTFTAYPGLIHPFAGNRVFHSSWVSKDRSGDSRRATRESAGVNQWRVPRNQFVMEAGSWQIWYHPE